MTDDNKIMTNEEIIAECRRRGLQNGASLGSHSGFMDLVADRLEELIEENKQLKLYNENNLTTIKEKTETIGFLKEQLTDFSDMYCNVKTETIKQFVNKILGPYAGKPYLSKGDLENIVNLLAKYY